MEGRHLKENVQRIYFVVAESHMGNSDFSITSGHRQASLITPTLPTETQIARGGDAAGWVCVFKEPAQWIRGGKCMDK